MKRTNAIYFSFLVFDIVMHSYRFLEVFPNLLLFIPAAGWIFSFECLTIIVSKTTLLNLLKNFLSHMICLFASVILLCPKLWAASNVSTVHIVGTHTAQELQLNFIPPCYPCPFSPYVLLKLLDSFTKSPF